MDYNKIGTFITEERKKLGLTQAKIAGKLFVSEKTVSKWENGKGLPDTSVLKNLCEIFDVTVNELLNGERISSDNYKGKAENKLLELQEKKENSDKILLIVEIFLGVVAVLVFVATLMAFEVLFKAGKQALGTIIFVGGLFVFVSSMSVCLLIEQRAGYYMCPKCNHKHVPTYKQVFLAPHICRSRYMKCPNCKEFSYHKKVLK